MDQLPFPSVPGRTFELLGGDIITLRVVGEESGGAYVDARHDHAGGDGAAAAYSPSRG